MDTANSVDDTYGYFKLFKYQLEYLHTQCYLWVSYDSHNRQRLFAKTAFTGWSVSVMEKTCVLPVNRKNFHFPSS